MAAVLSCEFGAWNLLSVLCLKFRTFPEVVSFPYIQSGKDTTYMARHKRKKNAKKEREDTEWESPISSEALRGVAAILLAALALFLILAALGLAGNAGTFIYEALTALVGIGYLLLPLSLFLLAVVIFRSFERALSVVQIGGTVVFLFSTLALVSVAFEGQGGIIGGVLAASLISLFDTAATTVFLVAFALASLIIAFNVHLGALAASLRSRTAGSGDAPTVESVQIGGLTAENEEEDEEEDTVEKEDDAPQEEPAAPRAPVIARAALESDESGGFPIIAAEGRAYTPPPLSLLGKNKGRPEVGDVKANMNIIKRTLQNFGIQVEMDEVSIGPTVTRYAMKPAEGVRLSKIVALHSNLELALAASPVRIEAPIPGKSLVGVEVPNISRTTLGLAPLLSDSAYTQSDKPLLLALGRSITGQPHFADLARMPHMLVAGTTGAGKSVVIHDFVLSLLYRCGPERLRFIMVDPKRVELTLYNSIPHLLTPVITDAKKAILSLKWLAKEMERRYNILEAESVRDIASYHENVVAPSFAGASEGKPSQGKNGGPVEAMPYIVVIIDELADIMQAYPRELESGIVRLAQMSRAVGIHLILSTQRPSVKVITGLIKANIPARVAFQVASQIDSRTILDSGGAEQLLGAGDMLFLSGDMSKPRRIQAPYTGETEVKRVVSFIAKSNAGMLPSEIQLTESGVGGGTDAIFSSLSESDEDEDDLYGEAKRAVLEAGKASTSYLQRKLRIGYARAARLMDILEERGVISAADGAKPRSVVGDGNAGPSSSGAESDEFAREPVEDEEDGGYGRERV